MKKNGPMEESNARNLFSQVVDAVRYLHDEKVLAHRDLKVFEEQ